MGEVQALGVAVASECIFPHTASMLVLPWARVEHLE